MSLPLAHALEFPGKLRLDEQTYTVVQTIYYPGFTVGGIAEPVATVATLVLFLMMRDQGPQNRLPLIALVALAAMHLVFWSVTQPANRYWLKDQKLSKAGANFFPVGSVDARGRSQLGEANWRGFRDRWEYSHVARAILAGIAFIAINVVVATH